MRNAKVYPGADVDSDHNPVVATVAVNLKRILRVKNRVKWKLEKLKDIDSYSLEFRTGVDLALQKLIEHRSADNPEVKWTDFKETVTSVATETVGLKQSILLSKPWITSEMTDTMNERCKWKAVHTEEGRKKYTSQSIINFVGQQIRPMKCGGRNSVMKLKN